MNIENKVAIVTGASSGIGLATAKLLSLKGATVVLASRSKEVLKKLSRQLPNSYAVPTDMTVITDIQNMVKLTVKKYGSVDILINNAGQGFSSPLEKIDVEKFRKLVDLDLIGPIIAMQTVIPHMRKQKEGTIINISSGTALMSIPFISAYSSLKRALVGISLTAREELKKDNIAVSVVYPYITDTNFYKNTVNVSKYNFQNVRENMEDRPPADPPEFVAEKILEAIKTGRAEQYVHEWMSKTPAK